MHAPLAIQSALPDEERAARLRAVGLFLSAFLLFSGLDAVGKYLGSHLDPIMVTWARYVTHFALAVAVLNPYTAPGLFRTDRPWLQAFRALMLLASTACNFVALQYLQLAQTVSIQFSAPFMVAILAGPLLGEWVAPRRWAAIALGFLGVIVVTRPGTAGFHPAMLLSFAGTACYALYSISTRTLGRTDSAASMLVFSAAFASLALTPAMPAVWTWPDNALVWALLPLTGVLGALGHYLLIRAHQLAPASTLAPYGYFQIVWMVLLGMLVFGDVPDAWTLVGAAIVVVSGLVLLAGERRA